LFSDFIRQPADKGVFDMKLIRFLSEDDEVLWGTVNPPDNKRATVIRGSIFGKFEISSREVKVKKLLPPVSPPNILGIGMNYKTHAAETGINPPEIPVMFIKAAGSLIGPEDPILLPRVGAHQVDCEAELAIVIGKTAKNVPKEEAMSYILGYTCANDVSARDWQIRKQKTQWARGKSFDSFCPVGPWVVTKDEIPDPQRLRIQSDINGKIYQDSTTADMIFDIPTIVSNLSQSITLFAGSIILSGTPHGIGFTRIPPVFLKDGDIVTISIEKIGTLTNAVMAEE
jgi:2-keto-4-pentenoate hydratase/2-oxohepta-3-ene-1,7-dioic acid hydratase in catechol pathway